MNLNVTLVFRSSSVPSSTQKKRAKMSDKHFEMQLLMNQIGKREGENTKFYDSCAVIIMYLTEQVRN